MPQFALELWLVTQESYWRLSAWNSNRIFIYSLMFRLIQSFFPCFFLCAYSLSTNELSQVTVLIGLYAGDLSDVQMTRRMSKVVLHGKYNSATFVNCHNKLLLFIYHLLHFIWKTIFSIWFTLLTRPMTSPSSYWTRPWFYPGLLHLLVCHRPALTPTNTSTTMPWFWDGEKIVTKDYQRILPIIDF